MVIIYLKTDSYNLYLGGDSGYDTHFKKIGKEFGPFDIAILEAGQYNTAWPLIHIMPEQTVQAALDLEAKVLSLSIGANLHYQYTPGMSLLRGFKSCK